MNKDEAQKWFEKYLNKECPRCDAKVGELCDTDGVWIHLERMKLHPEFLA